MISNNTFGERLRELRESKNMSQKEFTERAEIPPSALSAYERGAKKPNLSTAEKIAQEFNVSLDWLCGLSDNQNIEIKTYLDLFNALVEITKAVKTDLSLHAIQPNQMSVGLQIMDNYDAGSFKFSSFVKEWKKMLDLKNEGTIDNELYLLWVEKQTEILSHKLIAEGLPF